MRHGAGTDGTPAGIDLARWWAAAREAWAKAGRDNAGLLASAVAFNAFLAFVPLLSAAVLTYGLVASPSQVAHHIAALTQALPSDAASLIAGQLEAVVETARSTAGLGLATALAISLYGAIRGATGIITGLNIVYDVEDGRPFLRRTAVALAITLGLLLAFGLASLAIALVNLVGGLLPEAGGAVHALLEIGFWVAAALVVSLVIALIYRFAPNRDTVDWAWLTPGSVLATLVWIAATFAFSFYVQNFASYNATYGSLGAVIVFLTWLYLSAYILLLGAELNRALERRQTA